MNIFNNNKTEPIHLDRVDCMYQLIIFVSRCIFFLLLKKNAKFITRIL